MSMADLMKRFGITHRGMVEVARSFDPDGDVFTDEELAQLFGPVDPAGSAVRVAANNLPPRDSLAAGLPAGSMGSRISGGKKARR